MVLRVASLVLQQRVLSTPRIDSFSSSLAHKDVEEERKMRSRFFLCRLWSCTNPGLSAIYYYMVQYISQREKPLLQREKGFSVSLREGVISSRVASDLVASLMPVSITLENSPYDPPGVRAKTRGILRGSTGDKLQCDPAISSFNTLRLCKERMTKSLEQATKSLATSLAKSKGGNNLLLREA